MVGNYSFLSNSCAIPLLDFAVEDLSEVEQLKLEKIEDQKRIIKLQDDIIAVFGVPEEDSASVDSKLTDMLERLDQKPKVSAC